MSIVQHDKLTGLHFLLALISHAEKGNIGPFLLSSVSGMSNFILYRVPCIPADNLKVIPLGA